MIDFSHLPRLKPFQFEITCKLSEWARTFEVDEVEIERQILYAAGWIQNNPKKAPKKDMMRFLYNWLLIAKRKGSLIAKRQDITYKEKPSEDDEELSLDEMREIRRRNFPQYKPDPVKFKDSVTTEVVPDGDKP